VVLDTALFYLYTTIIDATNADFATIIER